MYISYTSKRRHRADILGQELAPSMVYTNWTAGNSATLSNDASGNLKVAYNAVSNPYAYRAITVAANSLYRIKVNSVSDGTAQLPVVSIGTTIGGNQLGEFDFRKSPATDAAGSVDIPVVSPGTTIYVSIYCAIGAAGYALFNGASAQQVTTLTHAVIEALHDGLIYSTGAYTANNSTLGLLNVMGIQGEDDNAISITNTGAVNGGAYRTNAFPTIASRKYKCSALWIPHSCTEGHVAAGNTLGSAALGDVRLYADLDAAAPFFSSASGLRWNFTNTDDGWTYTNATKVNAATYVSLTATTGDPYMSRAGLSFSGKTNRYVAARIRRTTAGSWNQPMELFYTTASHGASASYYANTPVQTLVNNEWTVVVFDMWRLSEGGSDWKDSTITGLRLDVTATNAATYDVDWVAVGNMNPLSLTLEASDNKTFLTFYNSNESNAISYYILPEAEQTESTYTLSQTGVNTLDPVDEYIVNETRTIAGVSYGLYDRTDEGWSIVSDKIEDAAKADWDEFFASCAALETFRFDPYATTDTTTTKTCELVPGSQKLTRIDKTSLWRAQFKVRVAA